MINVQDFLTQNQQLARLFPRNWEDLIEAQQIINSKFSDKDIANDLLGKVLVGHCFGEEIALAFHNWLHRYFPCEEDQRKGAVAEIMEKDLVEEAA